MVHSYNIPPEVIVEEGDTKVKSTRTKQVKKKKKGSVLKLRLDPELIRDKTVDELNEIIEREKKRLSLERSGSDTAKQSEGGCADVD